MYFDFEGHRPETPTIEPAISRREGFLLSVVVHAVLIALMFVAPRLPWVRDVIERAEQAAAEAAVRRQEVPREERFVFIQPLADVPAPAPPPRADLSDLDRQAQTVERAPDPVNRMPRSQGTTAERVEAMRPETARGAESAGAANGAEPSAENGSETAEMTPPVREGELARREIAPSESVPPSAPRGALGDALRNLQRYVEDQQFHNPEGGLGEVGPSIQFDSKGVDFGPWLRRFIAQIKRNWFVPLAAMTLRGHVVLTFNVHRDGSITDLAVVKPSNIDAFNNAAFNALATSNPTQPLPAEYPSDKAFFTVTFYYNETPAQ